MPSVQVAASVLIVGSIIVLANSNLGTQAALAADVATQGDLIFDGSRLVTPIPNASKSVKPPATRSVEPPAASPVEPPASGSSQTDSPKDSTSHPSKTASPDYCAPADRMVRQAEKKIARELAQSEQDLTMYQQMSQVINWLNQYCVWNHRWPEPVDETNQAVNQLCELVPNNPYKWKSKIQEAQGQSTDPDYLYYNQPMNQPTDASTGFEGDSPDPGTSFEALGNKRINLVFNPSLTVAEVKSWETDPPDEWNDDPGTITGISNGQNLIVVWGAGADGKPLKVPGSRKTRIFVSNVQMSATGNENQ